MNFRDWIKTIELPTDEIKLDEGVVVVDAKKFVNSHISIAEYLISVDNKAHAKTYIERLIQFRRKVEEKQKKE